MLKLGILLLIVIITINIQANEYIPPSDEELSAWWKSLTWEERIAELRKLDIIEHTIPEVIMPDVSAILSNQGGLYISFLNPIEVKIHTLYYSITMNTYKISDFHISKEKDFLDYCLPVFFGAGIGLIGTAIVNDSEPWHYGISLLQGGLLGFILSISL